MIIIIPPHLYLIILNVYFLTNLLCQMVLELTSVGGPSSPLIVVQDFRYKLSTLNFAK